jgi:ectoine hydroxylase-related dioxygenase (phytanoyl-CoA dioxygenase family)
MHHVATMYTTTAARCEQIDVEGFAVIASVFGRQEIDSFADTLLRESIARSRAGARHAMRYPLIASLAGDARLMQIAREVLGPGATPYRATLFDKSPTSNWLVVWHQDTALPLKDRADLPGWGPWSVKAGIHYAHAPSNALDSVLALRIHLDDSTASNGPLRVLPGTHRDGVLSDESVQRLAHEHSAVECIAKRGDVLAMRPLLIHASSKSHTAAPRRVLHIEYAASLHLGQGLELAIA